MMHITVRMLFEQEKTQRYLITVVTGSVSCLSIWVEVESRCRSLLVAASVLLAGGASECRNGVTFLESEWPPDSSQ